MPEADTPNSDDARTAELKSLDADIDAFEARRRAASPGLGDSGGVGEGYRLVAGLVGGVLGGVGLGWFVDRLAHTSPIGLISGLLIGTVVSVVGAVASAMRMSGRSPTEPGAPASGRAASDQEVRTLGSKDQKR